MDSISPSNEQWMYLLQHISQPQHTDMLTGIFKGPNGKVKLNAKWDALAPELNTRGGAQKTGEKWREAFAGLKSRSRKAYRSKTGYSHGTGGGPPPDVVGLGLSPVYEACLNLVGVTAAVGNPVLDPLQAQLNPAPAGPVLRRAAAALGCGSAAEARAPPAAAASVPTAEARAPPAAAVSCVPSGSKELPIYTVQSDGSLVPLVSCKDSPSFGACGFDDPSFDWKAFLNPVEGDLDRSMSRIKLEADVKPETIKEEWDDTTGFDEVQEVNEREVITLGDTPEKIVHTPPKGSGFTPVSKKRLLFHSEKQQVATGMPVVTAQDLDRELKLTRSAVKENTQAVLLLTAQLKKIQK